MTGWISLLAPAGGKKNVPRRTFSILKKEGHPFLYLPENSFQARMTLGLYPAQKPMARASIGFLHFLLRCGIPLPTDKLELPVDFHGSFGAFLKGLGVRGDEIPAFGVLEGYGHAPETRCIMLLFDGQNRPGPVVKMGTTPEAKELIRRAQDFFLPDGINRPGVIEALDFYRGDDAYVIVYAYAEGSSPDYAEKAKLGTVLTPWINESSALPLGEFPQWNLLEELQQDDPSLKPVLDVLRTTRIRSVLSHGDFTAWNIRISARGEWKVMDWERGQRQGLPAWDWFNYVVQYHLMVFHSTPRLIVSELEAIWAEPSFVQYAERARIGGVIRELTLVYLFYMNRYFPARHDSALLEVIWEFQKRHPARPPAT